MFCGKCGARVTELDLFCRRCGAPVKREEERVVSPPQRLRRSPARGHLRLVKGGKDVK